MENAQLPETKPPEEQPRVVVMLATFNGARHLAEQLASLRSQSVSRLDVVASDDGSTDATAAILAGEAARWEKGAFEVVAGPCEGFAENFRSLILRAGPGADFYAFCDQDDIWDDDKLMVAMSRLSQLPASTQALYCAATRTIAEDGRPIGMSPIMRRPPSFRNALVQSIAGGNTMVMNSAAFETMREACRDIRFVSHDWWAYIIVSGSGGTVVYDPVPKVSYRQHDRNLVGSNSSYVAKLRRVVRLLRNDFRGWNDKNVAALTKAKSMLKPESVAVLDGFAAARSLKGGLRRVKSIRRLGLYRQTWSADVMLFLGAFLGKL